MKQRQWWVGFCLCWLALAAQAGQITIAAAADLKFALEALTANFRQANPDAEVNLVFGSSGKFFTQIQQGAPYDLYFSADISYPQALIDARMAVAPLSPYALGRIVLWWRSSEAGQMTLADLTANRITRIALANPKHAPYGKRAEEALRATGLWDQVASKLVFGENIGQAAQFVQTGNAQVGIIALSLAMSPLFSKNGGYWLIPDHLHTPLEQGFVITRHGAQNAMARRFADYMTSPLAQEVMQKFGFAQPPKK